jgi:hypothetical protein
LTKQEKALVEKVATVMLRKNIEGNPEDFYSIEKKSTNNYLGTVNIGNFTAESHGKDIKTAIKNLTKEIK